MSTSIVFNQNGIDQNLHICSVLFQSIPQFIAHSDIAHSSKGTYHRCLKRFFSWAFKSCGKDSRLQREHLLNYKSFLDEQGLKPYTRATYLVAVRRFFEWSESVLLYPNISKGIKGVRRGGKSHSKDSISISHIKKLLGSIDQETILGRRDYALIFLLIHTGLRLIEISRALVSDLEIGPDHAILWVRGKGKEGKDAFVVITSEVLLLLKNYIFSRKVSLGSKKPLFASLSDRNFEKQITVFSLSRIIKLRFIAAGIKTSRITAHSLRHTFGVLAIKSGTSLYDVQLAMRHLSPQTTQVYLGDIEKEKRMEGAPEKNVALFLQNSIGDN